MRSDDELHHILSTPDDIGPSSGFVASVMDAVRSEAAVPPPIAFPWKRAIPLLVAALIVLVSFVVVVSNTPSAQAPSLQTQLVEVTTFGLGWILMSLMLTLVSVTVSLRLVQTPSDRLRKTG